jgi:aspartate 1-decarboxylase
MVNGAAARLFHKGDRVIVCAYGLLDDAEARAVQPKVVLLDAENCRV